MPEQTLKKESIVLNGTSPTPLSNDWISLIEASRLLGLKSIRQVYRRIEKHGIDQKRVASGTRVRSYVRRDDVERSRKLALEESQVSDISDDMSQDMSGETSPRRLGDVGHEVTREVIQHVIPQLKEFISNTGNKLEKIEAVRGLVSDLVDLIKEERIEKQKERAGGQEEREANIKAKEQERRVNLVKLVCYLIVTAAFCGFVFFASWRFFSWEPFRW